VRIDPQPDARTDLIVWDLPQAPPPGMRAPLWWAGDARAFAELAQARTLGSLRYADTAHGRVWAVAPPRDAVSARALFETWQQLQYPAPAHIAPSQTIEAAHSPLMAPGSGALRYLLTLALLVLFAVERILAHAQRR
jgi:hypothetical protein